MSILLINKNRVVPFIQWTIDNEELFPSLTQEICNLQCSKKIPRKTEYFFVNI